VGLPLPEQSTCPHCGKSVQVGWVVCPYCKQPLREQRRLSLIVLGLLMLGVVIVVIWLRGAGKSSLLAEWIARHVSSPIAALSATPTPLPIARVTPTLPPKATAILTRPPKLIPTITPSPTPLPLEITDEQGVPMVLVPAGPFIMGGEAEVLLAECELVFPGLGCSNMDFRSSEPEHTVTLDDYYIDKYEVTNASYAECEAAGACDPPYGLFLYREEALLGPVEIPWPDYYENPRYADYPMAFADWYEAQIYCQWRGARLPTEAEWEKAARGTDGRLYPWGNTYDSYPGPSTGRDNSEDVGDQLNPDFFSGDVSPYGVHNMMSGLWEMVADWFDPNYYNYSPAENPQGPASGEVHVLRGGMTRPAWIKCCIPFRFAEDDIKFSLERWGFVDLYSYGFRCARRVFPKEESQ